MIPYNRKAREIFVKESQVIKFFEPLNGCTMTAGNVHITTDKDHPFIEGEYPKFKEVLPNEPSAEEFRDSMKLHLHEIKMALTHNRYDLALRRIEFAQDEILKGGKE